MRGEREEDAATENEMNGQIIKGERKTRKQIEQERFLKWKERRAFVLRILGGIEETAKEMMSEKR